MEENQSNKKKLLSEEELLKVTRGDDLGSGAPLTESDVQACHERKKKKQCTFMDFDKCKWDGTSGKCVEK